MEFLSSEMDKKKKWQEGQVCGNQEKCSFEHAGFEIPMSPRARQWS